MSTSYPPITHKCVKGPTSTLIGTYHMLAPRNIITSSTFLFLTKELLFVFAFQVIMERVLVWL